jgi:hypothetical protein
MKLKWSISNEKQRLRGELAKTLVRLARPLALQGCADGKAIPLVKSTNIIGLGFGSPRRSDESSAMKFRRLKLHLGDPTRDICRPRHDRAPRAQGS